MVLRKITGLFVCALVIGCAAFATAGIPDPAESVANMAGVDAQGVALFVLPNGGGSNFSNAQILSGGTAGDIIDATIDCTINDAFGAPVVAFPAEDMWLASTAGGMVPCVGGTSADQNTDAAGYTTWANPLRAGGNDTGTCEVMISGVNLVPSALSEVPFALAFNSADINGDGGVSLADVGLFSGIFFGSYDFAADFHADGVISLADVGRMALGIGTACP